MNLLVLFLVLLFFVAMNLRTHLCVLLYEEHCWCYCWYSGMFHKWCHNTTSFMDHNLWYLNEIFNILGSITCKTITFSFKIHNSHVCGFNMRLFIALQLTKEKKIMLFIGHVIIRYESWLFTLKWDSILWILLFFMF